MDATEQLVGRRGKCTQSYSDLAELFLIQPLSCNNLPSKDEKFLGWWIFIKKPREIAELKFLCRPERWAKNWSFPKNWSDFANYLMDFPVFLVNTIFSKLQISCSFDNNAQLLES